MDASALDFFDNTFDIIFDKGKSFRETQRSLSGFKN